MKLKHYKTKVYNIQLQYNRLNHTYANSRFTLQKDIEYRPNLTLRLILLNPLRASDDFQKGLLNGETCDTLSPKMENMKTIRKSELKLSACIPIL